MKKLAHLLVLAAAMAAIAGSASAQSGPRPPTRLYGTQQYNMTEYSAVNRPTSRLTPRESGNPMVVRTAAKLAADLHAPCEVIEAAPLSDRPSSKPEYEIACKDALGWIISTGPDGKPLLNDCLALDTAALAAGKAWPKGMVCSLPGNAAPVAGLKPLAAKASPACTVADGTFLGGGGDPPIRRYEIACKGGGGYIVDAPAPGSAAAQSSLSCDEAKAAGVACTLTDKKHG
jgi:hypothetical protein